jgi:hypothetical protein
VIPAFWKIIFHSMGIFCTLNPDCGLNPTWLRCWKSEGADIMVLSIFPPFLVDSFLPNPNHPPPFSFLDFFLSASGEGGDKDCCMDGLGTNDSLL